MNINRKYSRKRKAILDMIRSTDTHPTADWVYENLRKSIPDISLGTVYRNIAIFKSEGLIISVGVVDGQERFDGNTREHTHFVCERCGAVLDIGEELDPSVNELVGKKNGVEVSSHQLTFFGLCKDCKNNEPAAGGSLL